MTHTAECDAAQAKYQAELKAYSEKWPNHCRHCAGVGSFYDPGTYWVDTCGECVDKGNCPRCGAATMTTGDEEKCSACGFNLMHPQETRPEFECICSWEE